MWIFVAFFAASLCSLSTLIEAENVEELTDDTFQDYMKVTRLAIVDFYAPWCGHCQKFAPEYTKAAQKAAESKLEVFFAKVNCNDSGKKTCTELNVKFLPTIRFFRDGKAIGDYEGDRKTDAVVTTVQKVLSSPNLDLKTLGMFSDALSSKIPSNVTPWNPDQKKEKKE